MKLSILTLLLSTVMATVSFAKINEKAMSKSKAPNEVLTSGASCKGQNQGQLTRKNNHQQVVANLEKNKNTVGATATK